MRDKVVRNHNRLQLLKMCVWSYKEIAEYLDCGSTKAIDIKKKAVAQFGGKVAYNNTLVRTEAVMNLLGTTREKEIALITSAEGNQNE